MPVSQACWASTDSISSFDLYETPKSRRCSRISRYDISETDVDKKPLQEFLLATNFLHVFGINFTGMISECFLNSLYK